MIPKQSSAVRALMLSSIIILVLLLTWSFKKSADIKTEAIASNGRINELEKEVADLRRQLLRTRQVLTSSVRKNDLTSKPVTDKLQDDEPAIAADMRALPAMGPVDTSPEQQLQDMPDPQQEAGEMADGKDAFASLDYRAAIESFARVDAEAEEYIAARMGIANAYFYSHQYEKALLEFGNVLSQQPGSVEAVIGMANAHQRLGQRLEQIAAYNKAIELEPKQWLHYNSRATAHLMNGDTDQAIRDFQEAGRLARPLKTDEATALENIGLIHINEAQWQAAFEHAGKVNRLDRKHSWNWLVRGIAAAKLERNLDAYIAYDEWFKYKRSTDPYLVKQLLPESLHEYVDVTQRGLSKLVDPPLISGERCENDYQCKSASCRPGPPFNKVNYCVAEDRLCSAPHSNGYLAGEILAIEGVKVRCYQPGSANARWTLDNSTGS